MHFMGKASRRTSLAVSMIREKGRSLLRGVVRRAATGHDAERQQLTKNLPDVVKIAGAVVVLYRRNDSLSMKHDVTMVRLPRRLIPAR